MVNRNLSYPYIRRNCYQLKPHIFVWPLAGLGLRIKLLILLQSDGVQLASAVGSSYFSPMKHLPMKKKPSADETLSANEKLSETSQNVSLAITLSLAVAKTMGMLNCSSNSLHSANERF